MLPHPLPLSIDTPLPGPHTPVSPSPSIILSVLPPAAKAVQTASRSLGCIRSRTIGPVAPLDAGQLDGEGFAHQQSLNSIHHIHSLGRKKSLAEWKSSHVCRPSVVETEFAGISFPPLLSSPLLVHEALSHTCWSIGPRGETNGFLSTSASPPSGRCSGYVRQSKSADDSFSEPRGPVHLSLKILVATATWPLTVKSIPCPDLPWSISPF
ncbi:hypothetical protein B0O80DRAFT_66876 [Mortierella sp. GBAus27b]|nr:hypothetical protein B0O80DRAFT_66876 [Mortierella sp. GBAus27b]